MAHVSPSGLCDLSCVNCPAGNPEFNGRTLLSLDTFKKFVDEAGDTLLYIILWSWGEPLLNKDLPKMAAYAREKGILTVSSTNLNRLTQEFAEELVDSGLDALIIALDTLGVNIAGLMAAGGIGGLAIGLAAKDMIANFFGGLTVFIDRPFSIGDWIVLKDHGIEGVVENIGWRQTTIRKFDRRPVYVPNSLFTTASVETPSRMTHRPIYETIGIRYDDIDRVDVITAEVKQMLNDHPGIDESQTLMVNFNAFAASSLDFFIYCLTHTVNWQEYHVVKQDVLLKVSEIIARHGASIAYPTRRLQLESTPQFAGMDLSGPATEHSS